MRQSTDATRLGANRTGLQMSPQHAKEMMENVDVVDADAAAIHQPDASQLAALRHEYVMDADPLGSIPPPGTMKGMAKSGAKMLTGSRPQAFVDKLAERFAFERGGTRLYDAVLVKFNARPAELKGASASDIEKIRDDEASHALLVRECIEQLGADPTAQTPCADLAGVESMGLLQAATDPRTTLAQTLHAALAAELVDNAGWETLIAMAENMGQKEMAERFRGALQQEAQHLAMIRRWYNDLTLQTGELM